MENDKKEIREKGRKKERRKEGKKQRKKEKKRRKKEEKKRKKETFIHYGLRFCIIYRTHTNYNAVWIQFLWFLSMFCTITSELTLSVTNKAFRILHSNSRESSPTFWTFCFQPLSQRDVVLQPSVLQRTELWQLLRPSHGSLYVWHWWTKDVWAR